MASEMVHYLNPLTLEAQLFLDSLGELTSTCNQIDPTLCDTLENVVIAIERFLEQKPYPIVATENTRLVPTKDLHCIQRLYQCNQCQLFLGKTPSVAAMHLIHKHRVQTRSEQRKERRRAEIEKRANAIIKLPKKTRALLNQDLSKFFNDSIQIAEKLKQMPYYEIIEKELLELVAPLFPNQPVKLYKFGSRMSGVGTRNSDLDIFVDIGNTFNNFENRASQDTLKSLQCVREALNKNRKTWTRLISIEHARVPILKVCNTSTNVECDIGFSNSLGYCNTKLLEYFFEVQPVARRMIIFLKKWIERSKLSDHFSTYSICLMIIYFLQINKYLPSVETLQKDLDKSSFVGPWIANFRALPLADLNIQVLDVKSCICKRLLQAFFEFYEDFNYGRFVICTYFGRITEIEKIESEMPKRYTDYINSGDAPKDCNLQLNKTMVVQDPIQLNHNVTKSISPSVLRNLSEYCRQSEEVFSEQAQLCRKKKPAVEKVGAPNVEVAVNAELPNEP